MMRKQRKIPQEIPNIMFLNFIMLCICHIFGIDESFFFGKDLEINFVNESQTSGSDFQWNFAHFLILGWESTYFGNDRRAAG